MTLALQDHMPPKLLEDSGHGGVVLLGKPESVTTENAAISHSSMLSSVPCVVFLGDAEHGWFDASSVSDKRQMQIRGTIHYAPRSNDPLAGLPSESRWDASAIFAPGGNNSTSSATAWIESAQIQRSYCHRLASLVEQNPTARFTGGLAISPCAAPSVDAALLGMLADLRGARAEAVEEGFPPPSALSIAEAERVLKATRRFSTRRFEVYPTPDGEIAIDMPVDGGSVLLLCDSDGGALCLVNLNGDKRQKRYDSAAELPDGFLTQAISELEHGADARA